MKLWALLFLTVATRVQGQPSSQPLPAPNGRLNVEFSDLSAIRELADGRVVLFDRREERLVVGDFASGTVYDVARKGQGPAEFEFVFALVPLAGDSTIAADMTRRWLILVGDSVVRKMLPEHVALQNASAPIGADGNGRVLGRAYGAATRDSTPIVLVHRASGRAETIARYANEGRRGSTRTPGAGGSFQVRKVPLQTAESPLLFSDGWVAVVRIDPYRVDWRAPDGRWTLGRPLPVRAVRLTAAEKAAYLTRKPGFRSATDWPGEMPPFETPVTLLASPDGHLLVHRLPTLAEPGVRYDVIDRAGNRVTQVVLGWKEHVLGFGARSVYVVTTDDDGIQRLRRHPWPSLRR